MSAAILVAVMFAHGGGDVTYPEAKAVALAGKGQVTWRFILAVHRPAGSPRVFYGCAVYRLRGLPPKGVVPGYYQCLSDAGGRAVWFVGGEWRPMPDER